jgi:hypothetical protein
MTGRLVSNLGLDIEGGSWVVFHHHLVLSALALAYLMVMIHARAQNLLVWSLGVAPVGNLPLSDSAALTSYEATHLTGNAYDHTFTSGALGGVEIVRPPLPKRPNDTRRAMWTDHFLVKGMVGK